MQINHVMIGSDDIDAAKDFYTKVLGVLGEAKPVDNVKDDGTKRVFFMIEGTSFALTQPIDGKPASEGNGSTIGFKCASAQQVKDFHEAAIAAGGKAIEDPPGKRDSNMGPVHLCYFLDLDGHKICGIYRGE